MTRPREKTEVKKQKAPRVQTTEAPSKTPAKVADRRRAESPKPREGRALSGSVPPAPLSAPGARISRRAADRLRAGHLWVYASDIEALEPGSGNSPALLPVADNRGLLLGTALYSPSSQIALRLVSREAVNEAGWLALLEKRLRKAIDLRAIGRKEGNDSCRLCFSEADELPGIVIDRYGPLLILQLLAKGLDSSAVRETIVRTLRDSTHLAAQSILERPDPRIRELEGLSAPGLAPLWAANADAPLTATQFHLNGLTFHYDANSGQKTGAFLDQAANYNAAQQWASLFAPGGRALDVCTYQGGFALHLARVSKSVTGIDASRASLEVAERNLEANRHVLGDKAVDWVEGDAFHILRDWAAAREQFDTIVLDPPAFAKSKRAVEGALRGYKELNLRALQMLRPGGLLVTCSCSHHVSPADLEASVASAAADAHRRVRLLARRGAAPDHPVVLNLPETEYLKCLVLQVDYD